MTGASADPVPFTVVGGYLGAGKTTLVNHLLRAGAGRRLAVVVNDFGAIDIDAALVEAAEGDMLSLANGCVCCSLAAGFAVVLQQLLDRDPPVEHVLVEVSGVGDPWQVAQWGRTPGLRLDGVIVLADTTAVREQAADRYVGDTVRRQLEAADVVVATKTDLVDALAASEVTAWLAQAAPGRPIVDAVFGAVPLGVLLGSHLDDRRPPGPAGHHELASWALAAERPVERAELEAWLVGLPEGVLRVKGVVRLAGSPERRAVVQAVGARREIVADRPWRADDADRAGIVVLARPGGSGRDIMEPLQSLLAGDPRETRP